MSLCSQFIDICNLVHDEHVKFLRMGLVNAAIEIKDIFDMRVTEMAVHYILSYKVVVMGGFFAFFAYLLYISKKCLPDGGPRRKLSGVIKKLSSTTEKDKYDHFHTSLVSWLHFPAFKHFIISRICGLIQFAIALENTFKCDCSWNKASAHCECCWCEAHNISNHGDPTHIYSRNDSDEKALCVWALSLCDYACLWASTHTFWVMREGEQADARCSGARAKNGHSFWVSFEGLDVFFDPPESLNLIQKAVVALGCLVSCA